MNEYWPRPGSMAEQAIERIAFLGGSVTARRIVEGIDGPLTTRGLRSCLGPSIEHGIVGCAEIGDEFSYWLIGKDAQPTDELRKVGPTWCWVPAAVESPQPPAVETAVVPPSPEKPSTPENAGDPHRHPRRVSVGRDGRMTIRSYGTTTVLDRPVTREVYDFVLDSVARDAP